MYDEILCYQLKLQSMVKDDSLVPSVVHKVNYILS